MKRLLLIFTIFISLNAFSQKSSITIKTGLTSSNVDNYKNEGPIMFLDSIYTTPLTFIEIGVGYTYKPKNWLWLSLEPGVRVAGHKYTDFTGQEATLSALYFNSPVVTTFNLGAEKLVVGLDIGFNPNIRITGRRELNFYPEILVGPRLGYKISDKVSLELYYRYGEGLKPYYSDKPLTTNYISLQTRIFLGK